MNANRGASLVLPILIASVVLAGPLGAQQPTRPAPSKTVRYADLDLSTEHGVHTLYHRIHVAAWAVCRDIVPPTGVTFAENLRCRWTLVEAAVAQVNNPALSALLPGHPSRDLTANR